MIGLIKQHDITDCGAACLASISYHYGLKVPISRIRQFANTDFHGTNVLGLIEAATKLGYQAKGVKGISASLNKIPLPAIAHMTIKDDLFHYVVLHKVAERYVFIMDPADGKIHRKRIATFCKEWTGVLVLLSPNEKFKKENLNVTNTSRFYKLIKPHLAMLLQILFGALVYTILGLSMAIFVQKITDYVLVDKNYSLLNLMSILMIGILSLQLFIGTVKNIFTLRTGQQIDARLILGYYKHLLSLPQQFFDTMRVGEIISRVNDAMKIRTFINEVFVGLAVNVFIIVFSFLLLFTYYWKLALLMLSVIPLYLILYLINNSLNKTTQRKQMEEAAELEAQLVESLNAVATIKRFGLEDFTNLKTEVRFTRLLRTVYKSNLIAIFSSSSLELLSKLLTISLLYIGSSYVLNNDITTGELFSFYTLIGYFTNPVATLISANKILQEALIATDRLFEVMDLEIEKDTANILITPDMIGDIHFENVGFSYGTKTNVFDNLSLHIKAGCFTAIIGESGSGKSTLMALLQNIYLIQSGNIYIGKYAIQYVNKSSLRRLIGVVPQRIDIFSGSILENIAVGEYEPDMRLIIDICSNLGIIGWIESLPNGFETRLNENGATLSGGQKQRIAIARALYRNPEVLIFDEATSSLDHAAEEYVQQTINLLLQKKKTIIVIAHRFSTIRQAHHIVVLNKGKVVEEGTHKDMLLANGHYTKLWEQQLL